MSAKNQVKSSVEWFKNKIKEPKRNKVYHKKPQIGNMYLYRYDAKWKEKLPFWDAQPLVIPVEYYRDGYLGLNFHYLPPSGRKSLLNALTKYTKEVRGKRKMAISYSILTSAISHPLFMPCVKRYLYTHVRTRFEYIHSDDWEKTIALPTQRFKGASSSKVWRTVARR